MKLGKLFKGVVEIAALPVVAAVETVVVGGITLIVPECRKHSPTIKLLKQIEEDLDDVTE